MRLLQQGERNERIT